MQMGNQKQPVMSEEKLEAIHERYCAKLLEIKPLREAYEEELQTNPAAQPSYKLRKLESTLQDFGHILATNWKQENDNEIEESMAAALLKDR